MNSKNNSTSVVIKEMQIFLMRLFLTLTLVNIFNTKILGIQESGETLLGECGVIAER